MSLPKTPEVKEIKEITGKDGNFLMHIVQNLISSGAKVSLINHWWQLSQGDSLKYIILAVERFPTLSTGAELFMNFRLFIPQRSINISSGLHIL